MKKTVALLGALAGAVLMTAQTTPTQTSAAPAAVTPVPPAKPAAPAKPIEKEEPKIPGIVLQRPGAAGNQLGLTIVEGTFKLSFYDKKRKAILADVTHARATWNPVYKAIPEQTVLNVLEGGKALGGGKPIRPPYAFKLRLTLLKGEGESETAAEPTYVIDIQDAALKQK
jgi:hypothetical protein